MSKKFEDLPVDVQKDIIARNAVIAEANKFIDELIAAKIDFSAREMAQGVEVKMIRPGFGKYKNICYKIFPWSK